MISVASTLLLASLVFGTVPSVSAAPVGTRAMNVREMRRMELQRSQPVRSRSHHSAIARVTRDTPVADSIVPRTEDTVAAAVVARADAPPSNPNSSNTTTTVVQKMRRHYETPNVDTPPRSVPRFKRDETAKRSTPDAASAVHARKEDATESNVARARDTDILPRAEGSSPPTTIGKRRLDNSSSGTPASHTPRQEHGDTGLSKRSFVSTPSTKREEATVADMPVKRDGPIKPIAMFRRALAWENLD